MSGTYQAFETRKFIRTNYRKTAGHTDYGDIVGIKVGSFRGYSANASDAYYTFVSGSGELGLGAGFVGSVLLFYQQIVGVQASVPSFSQKIARLTPLISGITYIGYYGFWLSKADSICDSMAGDSVSARYVIFVISR